PEPFLKAMNGLQVTATDTAMVGDWPTYDVRWPKRLGMRTVLAGWGAQEGHASVDASDRPWAVAQAPREVPELLATGPGPVPSELLRPAHTKPLTAF
ncbi:MAG: HAD hydrolase-like protein, partial [Candidatus Thermoplasmatota archaeon]|nr:HAD hydrolase-like protein [Candidatus Thermoplasmatota archaeon]